ncbi:MAG: hypothetical protein ACJAXI_000172 [Crocinitomicaceae bacterium]
MILFGILGILGILEAKELTAILSGVSGYILGKGAKSTPSNRSEEMAPAPAAALLLLDETALMRETLTVSIKNQIIQLRLDK